MRSREEKNGPTNREPEPPLLLEQEEDDIVEDQQSDSPAPAPDVLEVTQTREMKRKGIKLPKGWQILGVKRQSEICNNGESYQYFRYANFTSNYFKRHCIFKELIGSLNRLMEDHIKI